MVFSAAYGCISSHKKGCVPSFFRFPKENMDGTSLCQHNVHRIVLGLEDRTMLLSGQLRIQRIR